ncbi:NAD(P)/FAD-dependent oxidoreductase [Inquilinus sp. NPDC058860]|uniref:NAD(P)/FAD-dependent oxidoreductase n=1 Tax=Inquilinus sp. NPDC058860 TaxID=3346652 RepID=UPI0036D1D98F
MTVPTLDRPCAVSLPPSTLVRDQMKDYSEVVIVGGGPAGLAAAVYLSRFRRQVTVFDAGDSRSKLIAKSHNCPGYPAGISGPALLQRIRRQALKFGAAIIDGHVQSIGRVGDAFEVRSAAGVTVCRRIILATGIVDAVPDIPDLSKLIAVGTVRLCPVCDGYEVIGRKVAVLGPEAKAVREALFLRDYTPHLLVLCSPPSDGISALRQQALAEGIEISDSAEGLAAGNRGFTVILNAQSRQIDVLYAALGCTVRSELASTLGAQQDREGYVLVNEHQETSVDGVYAIGDVVRALNQIAVGFGHAALAATDIHNELRGTFRGTETL